MVDLDNTLVDFTQMLFNHIERNYGYKFDKDEVIDYNFSNLFYRKGCTKEEIYKFFNSVYSDETLYTNQLILTEYFNKIISIIQHYRNKGYNIVCHTKVSSKQMKKSKENLFNTKLKSIFDNIIIEYIEGSSIITSTKDYHYDVIIDDSPFVVKDYLENNQDGLVLLPVTKYNKFLLELYSDRNIQPINIDK